MTYKTCNYLYEVIRLAFGNGHQYYTVSCQVAYGLSGCHGSYDLSCLILWTACEKWPFFFPSLHIWILEANIFGQRKEILVPYSHNISWKMHKCFIVTLDIGERTYFNFRKSIWWLSYQGVIQDFALGVVYLTTPILETHTALMDLPMWKCIPYTDLCFVTQFKLIAIVATY